MIFVILGLVLIFGFVQLISDDSSTCNRIIWGIIDVVLVVAIVICANIAPPVEFSENRTLVEVYELEKIDEENFVCKGEDYYYYSLVNRTDLYFQESEICEIIEEGQCNLPRIEKYKRDRKTTFWSFNWGSRTEYVFYVPVGSVTE